ncbi:MAG: hypothetical protein Q4E73_10670 [Lachnospiraceae bacterium]|nr:hypothetical protein [Lachnospiraceae bacterium]
MSSERDLKKEQKRKEREERQKEIARSMSVAELEHSYKIRNRIYIAFFILTILSAFFRPWFYTIILIIITVREKRKRDNIAAAYQIRTGESIKSRKQIKQDV